MVFTLANVGLPGTSGFVGEFLTLLGTFESHPVLAVVATTGVIFAAYYMLPMVQKVFFNRLDKPENREVADLSRRELAILTPLIALMLVIGVHPTPVLERMEPSVRVVLERVEAGGPTLGVVESGIRAGVSGSDRSPLAHDGSTAARLASGAAPLQGDED
jgi:NADH-quinone oxidoreductase subunit M